MKVIHINQLGYRPHDRKSAAITAEAEAFRVVRAADGAIAWVGQTSEAAYDTASGENVCHADFSGLTEKGEYFVSAAGEASYPFVIADEPYKALKKALRDFFHYQRCGMDLECGTWSHLACHTKLAKVYGSAETKDVRGGWHDAGDYGRYVVPATMAVADLLLAHELTAGSAAADLVVPEIVRYELDWLLKMQDERSGGVYHKVSCKNFDAFDEMPEDEQEPLYLCPMSLSATADFAATMALSARFYPHRKDELLDAAKRAWKWCQAHHDMPPFENPPDITTGPYGNRFATDEFCENGRFWAACELFAATGAEQYHEYIRRSELYAGLGWGDMGGYGLYAYLYHAGGWADPEQAKRMKKRLHNACSEIMSRYHNDQFGVSLGEEYRWGSNMQVGNNAKMLLMGSLIFPEEAEVYRAAALTHFHYLLGHNSLSQSFVTGFGANAAKRPHHRPSIAKDKAVPGMVVGGPIRHTTHDTTLAAACREDLPAAKRYVDHAESYSSNEVTIYWNSPVYFMMAALGL